MLLSCINVFLSPFHSFFFFFKTLFIFRERGREGEREEEKHQCVVASYMPPTGDLVNNPGMCPDGEIEPATLWFAARTQSTELQWPGLSLPLFKSNENMSLDEDLKKKKASGPACAQKGTCTFHCRDRAGSPAAHLIPQVKEEMLVPFCPHEADRSS